jgi:hypothetical protein
MNKLAQFSLAVAVALPLSGKAADDPDGGMGSLARITAGISRSICPENPTGGKGAGALPPNDEIRQEMAGDPGREWKLRPAISIGPGETATLANITGSGAIRHIWMTPGGNWRLTILRIYWDGEESPSVEAPVGDFFGMGWGRFALLSSLAVCVAPGSGFNCYWEMPFHRSARITLENTDTKQMGVYYQVDYELVPIPADSGYFHAQFRRSAPGTTSELYTILDGVKGRGQYVGTYLAFGSHGHGWWGEGEVKFYLDGDTTNPTICGTGTEDYFGGAHDFYSPVAHKIAEYCTPYAGLHQVIEDNGPNPHPKFGMYRWHIRDPIRFGSDLRVTIQALGWDGKEDDLASVAYWYQMPPHAPFPLLGDGKTR